MPEAIPHADGYRRNQGNENDAIGWHLGWRQDGAPHERAADAVSVLLDEKSDAIPQGATQPRSSDGRAEQSERSRLVGRVASVNNDPVQPANLLADPGNRLRRGCGSFQGTYISVRSSDEGKLLGNPIAGE